eukprot:s2315_g3.t9
MPLTPQPNAWHARLHGSLREGVYFTEVLLGSPRPQRASLIVDTASWVTELTCTGQMSEGLDWRLQFMPRYLVMLTSSFVADVAEDRCSFEEKYLEGSSLQGRWFRDSLRFVSANGSTEPLTASVGCALKESGLFHAQQQNGILGLAPGSATKPTMIWQAFKKARGAKSRNRVFSLSLGGEGGELVIGADTAHVGQWVPLQISGSSGKYGVKVEALMFNGHSIPCRGRAQLDSASTFTYLPKEAETQLRRALADFCKGQQCVPADPPAATGDEASRHCWNVQGGTASISTKRFPVLSWRLQGLEVPWPPSRYLVRYSGKRVRLCYTFRATNALPDGSQIVLGASWMVGQELLFDIDKSRLGLTKANTRANGSEPSLRHRDSPQRRRVVPSFGLRDAPSSRAVEQPGPITTTRTDLTTALSDSPAAETSSSGVSLPLPDPVLGFELETQIVEGAAGLLLLGAFVLRARRKLWRLLFNCLRGERS